MSRQTNHGEGVLYTVSAPSGAGKTSLVKALLQQNPRIELSVSHTTRQPRPGEQNGSDYHFIDSQQFLTMVEQHAFLEHAEVFGNFYGTAHASINQRLAAGVDVILEIDWQGAAQIQQSCPEAKSIFILPPSLTVLESRLRGRQSDSEAVIQRRLSEAVYEMRHYTLFNYLIINDNFTTALADLEAIFHCQQLRTARQYEKLKTTVDALIA
ncbi:MAG: guanylate kinase [Gammaproteobacteria bacterium]|nr:guanylate kinase [Gammaproteobacteria bacterium]